MFIMFNDQLDDININRFPCAIFINLYILMLTFPGILITLYLIKNSFFITIIQGSSLLLFLQMIQYYDIIEGEDEEIFDNRRTEENKKTNFIGLDNNKIKKYIIRVIISIVTLVMYNNLLNALY